MGKLGGKGRNTAPPSNPASTHTGAGTSGGARGGSRTSSEHAGRRADPADMQELENRMAALGEIRTEEQEAEFLELQQQRDELLQEQARRMLSTVTQGAAIAQPQRTAQEGMQARSPARSPIRSPSPVRSRDDSAVSGDEDGDEEQEDDLGESMRQPSPLRLFQLRVLRMRRLAAFRRKYSERINALRDAYAQATGGDGAALFTPLRRFRVKPSHGVPLTMDQEGFNGVVDALLNAEPLVNGMSSTVNVLMQTVQTQAGVITDLDKRVKVLEAENQSCKDRLDAISIQQAAQHSDMQQLQTADRRQEARWGWQKAFNVSTAQTIDAFVGVVKQLVADPEDVQREILHTPLQPFALDRTQPLPDGPLIKFGEATGMDVDNDSASARLHARDSTGAVGSGDAAAKEQRGGNGGNTGGGEAAAAAGGGHTAQPAGEMSATKMLEILLNRLNDMTANRNNSDREDPATPDAQVGVAEGEAGAAGSGGKGPRMKAPKTFTGEADSYELDEALYCFESYCRGSDIPRAKWPMHCANFLGGAALTSYITFAKALQEKHGPDAMPTWDQFQECLQLFAKPEARLRAQRELFDLRQTGTAVDYARKFKLLVARSGNKTATEDLILMFHRGLKDPDAVDKDPLTKKWWTSLDDLVNAVVQAELSSGLRKSGGTVERGRPIFNRFKVRGGVSKLKAAMVPAQGRKRTGGKPYPGQDAKKFRGGGRFGGKSSDGGDAESCAVCQALNKPNQKHPGGQSKCFHWKELKNKQPAVYSMLAKAAGRDTSKDESN